MAVATRTPLAVLKVRHAGALKMVGKLFYLKRAPTHDPDNNLGFLHCHRANQRHEQTNCPAPLDEAAVYWLLAHRVNFVYCYEMDSKVMRKALTADIHAAPTIAQDRRVRHCLPEPDWAALGGVTERRHPDGSRTYHHPRYGLILATPFLRPEVVAEMPEAF